MDLASYVAALREDLSTAASAGDEQTRRTAALLAAALEPAARLALMSALSDMAAEITAALEDRVVEVRLDGREVQVAVTGPTPAHSPGAQQAGPAPDPGGDVSRITLRLLDQIKEQAERAAAAQGVSLNAWVSQAVQGALGGHRRPGGPVPWGSNWRPGEPPPPWGSRIRGWVQG